MLLTLLVNRSRAFARGASNLLATSDAIARATILNRSTTDSSSIVDVGSSSQVLARNASNSEVTLDIANGGKSANRGVTDIQSIMDAVAKLALLSRSSNESFTTNDTQARMQSLSRAISDTSTISDSAARSPSLNKGTSDVLSIADSAARQATVVRSNAESLTVTDAATRAQALGRSTSDTSSNTDVAGKKISFIRPTSETLSIIDSSSKMFGGFRSTSDVSSIADSSLFSRNAFFASSDGFTTIDTPNRSLTYGRIASEALATTDAATKFTLVNRSILETLSLTDSASRSVVYLRYAANTIFTSDIAVALGHRVGDPVTTPGTTGSPYQTPKFSSATTPGSINKKYVIYYGLMSPDLSKQVLVPKGTFIATTAAGSVTAGKNVQTLHGFDIVKEFNFPVYSDFPHPLYGNQNDIRYDANYNLKNPSYDNRTYVCDAKKFMTGLTDNAFFSSNYTNIFGAVSSGSPVNVFVGVPGAPATVPVSAATYTWFPDSGTVVFASAQASNAVVSIDGVPQAMAPEMMMQHLFLDYAQWDPNYLNLDKSNTLIPTYVGGRGSSVWQIAQDIAAQTAPRGVRWQIRVDEYGRINFYEARIAATPVAVLTDERDLFNIQYTLTSEQLVNVVTADSISNTNQPLKSVAYDVPSITEDGQRSPFTIPTNLLLVTRGYNSGTAISLMNTLTASELYERSKPTLELSCNIVPNYLLQVGDKVTVQEQALGLSGPYIIKGIDDAVRSGNKGEMTLRMSKAHIFANMNMGLPSAVTNAMNQTSANMTNSLAGKTGIISGVSINGLAAISSGTTAKDYLGNAVIPIVSPTSSWSFAVSIDPSQGYDTVMEHYVYFECANTLFTDTAMAFRMPGIVNGTVIPAATITGGYTATGTHSTGTMTNGGIESSYKYSNIVISAVASSLPAGYNGSFGTVNNVTNAQQYLGSTSTYGIGLGPSFLGSYAYLPKQKQNYGYFVIQAANSNGAFSFLRVPFILQL